MQAFGKLFNVIFPNIPTEFFYLPVQAERKSFNILGIWGHLEQLKCFIFLNVFVTCFKKLAWTYLYYDNDKLFNREIFDAVSVIIYLFCQAQNTLGLHCAIVYSEQSVCV